jgi:two-component system chemotaxis sensor kinase CheA
MRMLPIAGVFQKMARLVRDLAAKSGKKVRLVTSGEGTELDRSVVEQIHDPLVHMVRNAVDHAIERPDERVRAGKDAQGTVRLSAFHEGGHVVLTLEDDGRGLDREAILKKARAQGLVKEGETLSDAEVHQLIFLPGFSTAKQVTEISGRGVGMDVVRRNIEAMRGRIGITSVPSRGTTFRVHIPLTLAIIDGMLVECGAERFILPTLSVLESILPDRGAINAFTGKYETITVRGEVIPLLRLDRILGVTGAKTDAAECLVVIVEAAGRKVGLLVDDIAMRQQVVIKRLDGALGEQRCLAGGAILPDGRVGLILNVDEIGNLAQAGC